VSIFCRAVRQDHAQNAFPNSRGRALLSCKFLFRQYGRRYDDALDAYERSPHFPKTSLCKRKCSTLYRISQFVHAPWRVFPGRRPSRSTLQCAVAVCWSVLECAAGVCWCLLKCAEVCCSVLQCAAVCCRVLISRRNGRFLKKRWRHVRRSKGTQEAEPSC